MALGKVSGDRDQIRLVAEFFSNVGVAWFVAGVIGIFVGSVKNASDALISLSWGIFFSLLFLFIGARIMKGAK